MSYYHNYNLRIILLFITFIFGVADPSPSQWLTPHNMARRAIGLSPLTWDTKLATFAKSYANRRRYGCAMIHSNGPYGENLYWGAGQSWTPGQAVTGWVSEKRDYNVRTNTCRISDCGHYTQIVWKSTKRVGCARVPCAGGAGVLFVCEYFPPGNFDGEKPY